MPSESPLGRYGCGLQPETFQFGTAGHEPMRSRWARSPGPYGSLKECEGVGEILRLARVLL